jgi:hypothetical protein
MKRDLNAEQNCVAAGDGCTGSVSRYLGLLATVSSRPDDAARRFEEGLERNARMGHGRGWPITNTTSP